MDYVGELLEEVVLVVGDAFDDMLGDDYMRAYARPLQAKLKGVRESHPLSD